MKLPPRWLRRLVLHPAVVIGVVVALGAIPLWFIAAMVLSRFVPGKWRILRIVWFLFLYLTVEAAALIVLFALWVASGLGWKIDRPWFRRIHYVLLGWVLRMIVGSAKRSFKLRLVVDDPHRERGGDTARPPTLVLSRHAGPGDSLLLMDVLVNVYRREPRVVLKDFLQWDPVVDVTLNRLPATFVPSDRAGRDLIVDAIAEMAGSMDSDDAFVIFPEGANYTTNRHKRAIKKLREIGRPDLAERAADLRRTLPPRVAGVEAALERAPVGTDLFLVGHAGLEALVTPGDIWRAMPMDTEIAARVWHVPANKIPDSSSRERWLYDMWAEIDDWITSHLAITAEPGEADG